MLLTIVRGVMAVLIIFLLGFITGNMNKSMMEEEGSLWIGVVGIALLAMLIGSFLPALLGG